MTRIGKSKSYAFTREPRNFLARSFTPEGVTLTLSRHYRRASLYLVRPPDLIPVSAKRNVSDCTSRVLYERYPAVVDHVWVIPDEFSVRLRDQLPGLAKGLRCAEHVAFAADCEDDAFADLIFADVCVADLEVDRCRFWTLGQPRAFAEDLFLSAPGYSAQVC